MDSMEFCIDEKINELFDNIKGKANIELGKLNSKRYTKGIIKYISKFIYSYININSNSIRKNQIWRFFNYFSTNPTKTSPGWNYRFLFRHKLIIKNILLIYLTIYDYHISILSNINISSSNKHIIISKLYNLLQIMSPIISTLYFNNIIDITELGMILKMLIIFTINNNSRNIQENSDIKNIMYFKECINIIKIIFRNKHNEYEQKYLIDIFNYINNNLCFLDKENNNINYTNKLYLLNNDHKTTKLISLVPLIYTIDNKDLTKIYFDFLINIYFFHFSYNNFTWDLYASLQHLLENIKEKTYKTISQEISFPQFHFNFINELILKERNFIKNNINIFKNAFYFSGKQINSGIIADIGKISDHFLLAFGFNLITNEIKDEYIIFQIKNYEEKVQLKASIFKNNNDYILYIID